MLFFSFFHFLLDLFQVLEDLFFLFFFLLFFHLNPFLELLFFLQLFPLHFFLAQLLYFFFVLPDNFGKFPIFFLEFLDLLRTPLL